MRKLYFSLGLIASAGFAYALIAQLPPGTGGDGDSRFTQQRDRPPPRDGERGPPPRDGERGPPPRDGERGPPRDGDRGPPPPPHRGDDRGPPHGFPPPQIGVVIPGIIQDQMSLTIEQRHRLLDLQAEVDNQLAEILTPEQLRHIKNFRPGRPGDGEHPPGPPGLHRPDVPRDVHPQGDRERPDRERTERVRPESERERPSAERERGEVDDGNDDEAAESEAESA